MTIKGNLYVIAAPSGTGKTSLVKAVCDGLSDVMISISYTTRLPRTSEVDGVNYYFTDRAEFESMVESGDFLEHAVVFEHLYGTSRSWVMKQLANGKDVILEIDWQGHQQIKEIMPNAISIFILPPTLTDLSSRLVLRKQDQPEIIEKRLLDAKETVSHLDEFDYVVLNEHFDHAKEDLMAIIRANRLTTSRQFKKLFNIIKEMSV